MWPQAVIMNLYRSIFEWQTFQLENFDSWLELQIL